MSASSFGDPGKAIDGRSQTAWTYQLGPNTSGKVGVGLAIRLKSAEQMASVKLTTTTPGMTVILYGSQRGEPSSVNDPLWLQLARAQRVKSSTTITANTLGESMIWLLVWITTAPSGMTTGTLGISEVSITPPPN